MGALQPLTLYTLTVAIGNRGSLPAGIAIEGTISLVNGVDPFGTELASGSLLPSTTQIFEDLTITFTTGEVVSDDLIVALSVIHTGGAPSRPTSTMCA